MHLGPPTYGYGDCCWRGAVSIALYRLLCADSQGALHGALTVNLVVALYLVFLLACGAGDHPIGVFLAAAVSSYVALLLLRENLAGPGVREHSLSIDPSCVPAEHS
jgi:hypothetical protein